MRKYYFLLLLGFFSVIIYSKYGYLLKIKNLNPAPQKISDAPLVEKTPIESDRELNYLKLEDGASISYFAKNVPGARSLARGKNGVIFVGTRAEGVVYALQDADGDGRSEARYVVASGLNNPNGVVYDQGTLYVAEINRIIKFENIDSNFLDHPSFKTIYTTLPKKAHHGWRYLSLGPDKRLYLGIGAPCNECLIEDPYGTIVSLNRDGSDFRVEARGIRNTVGLDWNPADSSLWFTENGRDLLGDDKPTDELNRVVSSGNHFGFPYCHQGNILDPVYGKGRNCLDFVAPTLNLSPHAAALGMKFVGEKIYLAEHGSWNRQDPIGYRVMSVDVTRNQASNYHPIVSGWLGADGTVKGRPVDILVLDTHNLLISDDFSGAIYRLSIK